MQRLQPPACLRGDRPLVQLAGQLLHDVRRLPVVLHLGLDQSGQLAHLLNLQAQETHVGGVTRVQKPRQYRSCSSEPLK